MLRKLPSRRHRCRCLCYEPRLSRADEATNNADEGYKQCRNAAQLCWQLPDHSSKRSGNLSNSQVAAAEETGIWREWPFRACRHRIQHLDPSAPASRFMPLRSSSGCARLAQAKALTLMLFSSNPVHLPNYLYRTSKLDRRIRNTLLLC